MNFGLSSKLLKKYSTRKECNQKAHLEGTSPLTILNLEIHK